MNAQGIDDKPQERESAVRHAHAVEASRHGRASTPGYLGLPAEEEPNAGTEDSQPAGAREGSSGGRTGRRSPGRARGRDTSRSSTSGSDAGGKRGGATARKSEKEKNGRTGRARTQGEKPAHSKGRAADSGGAAGKPQRSGKRTSAARKTSTKAADGGGRRAGARKPSRGEGGSAGRARKGPKKLGGGGRGGGRAQAAASSVRSKVASTGDAVGDAAGKRVRREAVRVGGSLLSHALRRGWRRVRRAMIEAGGRGVERILEGTHPLPIQRSIDVAVPPEVAWEQWLELKHLPEGPHRLSDVQRDGDELTATIGGPRGGDWAAEVIDERDRESFAWRSTEGSDSAGLATFHPLGERLTRIELTVDVRPEDIGQAALLALHVADRRVEEELRRFKAEAELLNPDIYEELLAADGADGSAHGAAA
jgi:uncharacterized membrane protein